MPYNFISNLPTVSRFNIFICYVLLVLSLLPQGNVQAQSGNCSPAVPFHLVDLSSSPSATYLSPSGSRSNNCCGTSHPDRCVEFEIYLHPSSTGILFDINSGAVPSGSMYYQINCGPIIPVGQMVCLSSQGPHYLTFCKPGNNPNSYIIRSIPGAYSTLDAEVRMGCTITLRGEGLNPSTVVWRDITGGGVFDSLLSCTTGCNVTQFTPAPGIPSLIQYEICGSILDTICNNYYYICDTVQVTVYPELQGVVPDTVFYCLLNGGITLSSGVTGGNGVYTYRWLDGNGNLLATTPTYFAGVGFYTVEVRDGFPNCPPFLSQFLVKSDRGASVNPGTYPPVCADYPTIQLNGSVSGVSGGYWSGGSGTFSPDNDTLNAFYTPHSSEIINGTYTLTLTSYADTVCPVVSQSVTFYFTDNIYPSTTYIKHISCYGGSNGAFTVAASGGIAPFTYSIDGVTYQPSGSFTNLPAGNYTVYVRDDLGCMVEHPVTLYQPNALAINGIPQHVTCFGGNNGRINLVFSGGVTPYNFIWSTGMTGLFIENLTAGTYTVTASDANGCSMSDTIEITQPVDMTAVASNTSPGCKGASVTLSVTSNTGTSYSWSGPNGFSATGNFITIQNITALHAGTYTVTVTNGVCSKTATTIITVWDNPMINAGSDTSLCGGSIYMMGGSPTAGGTLAPYRYQWFPGNNLSSDTAANPFLVVTGTYNYYLAVTDARGCSTFDTVNVILGGCAQICMAAKGPNILGQMGSFSEPYMDPNNTTSANCIRDGLNSYSPFNNIANSKPDLTTYVYASGSGGLFPEGRYTFVKTLGDSSGANCLHTNFRAKDHTGDGGYFMAINGSPDVGSFGSTFFQLDSIPVCPNSNYEFSAYITNILSGLYAQDSLAFPNVSFYVNGVIVATSGPIPNNPGQVFNDWKQYGGLWYSGSSNFASIRIDNATFVANGNDLGLDDITFQVCGPTIIEEQPPQPVCSNETVTIIHSVNSQGTTEYSWYKWQVSADDGITWNDASGVLNETQNPSFFYATITVNPTLTMDGYQYRIVVANDSASIAAMNTFCYVMGPASIIIVKPAPTAFAGIDRTICPGDSTILGGSPSATGGTSPYNYTWNNASSINSPYLENPIAFPASDVDYILTVTDYLGCTDTDTVNIRVSLPIIITEILSHPSCNGFSDGSINITVSGGTSPFNFSWSNNATTEDIANLTAGNYSVTISDINQCEGGAAFLLTEPVTLLLITSAQEVSCFGENNGAIDVTVSGGTLPYAFQWSDAATIQNRSSLTTGNYAVTLTDANNCSVSENIFIAQPDTMIIAESISDVTCFGLNNATIDIAVTGGRTPYRYMWSHGATTQDAGSLYAGNYSVTITDANNCVAIASYVVQQPNMLIALADKFNPTCYGFNNGSIDVSVAGGTQPYYFSWSNSMTTEDITSLPAGTYNLVITDVNLCQNYISATLTQPDSIALNTLWRNVSCFGFSDGAINLSLTGGVTPYQILWNDGIQDEDRNNLVAGYYSVTITDNNGCVKINDIDIEQPDTILVAETLKHVSCNGGNDGAIDIIVSGGILPYQYQWTGGMNSENIDSLSAGNYSLTLTDDNGCITNAGYDIMQPDVLSASTSFINPTCNGLSNGSIDLMIAGGTLPYSYLWSNGFTSQDITGLSADAYFAIITDAYQCSDSVAVIITEPDSLLLDGIVQHITCYNSGDGSIDILATGGTTPYSYLWDDGINIANRNSLVPGTYAITVTDIQGCVIVASFDVTQPDSIIISENITHASCFDGNNGAVDITISGGTIPYQYLWSVMSTTEDIDTLTTGNYSVTVTDLNNCIANANYFVTQPDDIVITLTAEHVSCYDGNDGRLTASVSGGIMPYNFSWSNGDSVAVASALIARQHQVTVTDANGCVKDAIANITQPYLLQSIGSIQHVTCFQGNDGSIQVNPFGGTMPFQYQWSDGSTAKNRTQLSAGAYTVTVTDANNCTNIMEYFILQNSLLNINLQGTELICQNTLSGEIKATTSGGMSPYRYIWSTGVNNSNTTTSLPAGNYQVTVTDNMNCTATASYSIAEYQYNADFSFNDNEVCLGETITVNDVSASSNPVVAQVWNFGDGNTANGNTSQHQYSNTGTYTVSLFIEMDNGCFDTVQKPVIIRGLPVAFAGNDVSVCPGQSVTLTGSGGAYYQWLPQTDTATISPRINIVTPVDTSEFILKVTNIYGCDDFDTVKVMVHKVAPLTVSNDTLVCPGASVTLQVSGAATYEWKPAIDLSCTTCASPVATPSAQRQYVVNAKDANRCELSDTVRINIAPLPGGITSAPDTVCNGSSVQLQAEEHHRYQWSPAVSLNRNDIFNPIATPSESTTYEVIITNIFGCSITDAVTIDVFPYPDTQLPDTLKICSGESTTITSDIQYNYQWTPSTGLSCDDCHNPVANPQQSTLFIATVTTPVGCTVYDSVFVKVNPLPFVYAGDNFTICKKDSITLQAAALNNVTISWQPPTGLSNPNVLNPKASPLSSTLYHIHVTDANGCRNTDDVFVEIINQVAFKLDDELKVCKGQSVTLRPDSLFVSDAGVKYIWHPRALFENHQAKEQTFIPTQDETIMLIIESGNCIPDTQRVFIDVVPAPSVTIRAPEIVIAGERFQMTASAFRADTYEWTPDSNLSCATCAEVWASIQEPTMFHVKVADVNGCTAEDSAYVQMLADCGASIFIPNSFTPNGDEINDRFCVRSLELHGIRIFRVFNRWGQLVFETDDIHQCWDGKFNGKSVNPDVYVYYVEGICTNGRYKMLKGNVTVIK
jgi:gliding motility-associated-like protein